MRYRTGPPTGVTLICGGASESHLAEDEVIADGAMQVVPIDIDHPGNDGALGADTAGISVLTRSTSMPNSCAREIRLATCAAPHQRLGGDAADVDARPADHPALDEGDAMPGFAQIGCQRFPSFA